MSTLTHCYILNWLYHIEYLLNCCLINPIIFNSCVLNSNLREIIIILSSTVTVDIVEGYNLVELNKPNTPNGYKLLGCIGVSHSTTNNVAINAVANNGKLRVFNNTSKILNNIIFTGTWLLYKISK